MGKVLIPDAARLHRVEPGAKIDLPAIDPADVSAAPGDKETTKEASQALVARLAELQDILWARQQERLLVVLQPLRPPRRRKRSARNCFSGSLTERRTFRSMMRAIPTIAKRHLRRSTVSRKRRRDLVCWRASRSQESR